jgi:hypothetical protein
MITEILVKHRANLIGNVRNRAELEDVVRELFKPGSRAMRTRASSPTHGARRPSIFAPLQRSGRADRQARELGLAAIAQLKARPRRRFEKWRNFIVPLLDRGRMIDNQTGEPFTDAALELALRDVFETIRTDGWSSIKAGAAGGKMLANQKAEHRFLHFTDGDAWLAYHNEFGAGSPFDAMMGHVDTMSRDIALDGDPRPEPGGDGALAQRHDREVGASSTRRRDRRRSSAPQGRAADPAAL